MRTMCVRLVGVLAICAAGLPLAPAWAGQDTHAHPVPGPAVAQGQPAPPSGSPHHAIVGDPRFSPGRIDVVDPLAGTIPVTLSRLGCDQAGSRVRLPGPAGLVITGSVSCRASSWSLRVDGGVGEIAGVALKPQLFGGSLRATTGDAVTGKVVIDLPHQPRVVPRWSQSARVSLIPVRDRWAAQVSVRQWHRDDVLDMSGPLLDDGTYRLRAAGTVSFAGGRIPLSGTLMSGSPGHPSRWRIGGTGSPVTIDGARMPAPGIAMTERAPGVTGSGDLRLSGPSPLSVSVALDIVGSREWVMTAESTNRRMWSTAALPTMRVAMDRLTGTVTSTPRGRTWRLTAPMLLTDDQLRVTGSFTFERPQRWRVRALSGTGSVLESTATTYTAAPTSVVIDRRGASGRLTLIGNRELMFDLPEGWASRSVYSLMPRKAAGVVSFDRSLAHSMSRKGSRVILSGVVPRSGSLRLAASGSLRINDTDVPVRGYYIGGPGKPRWDVTAQISTPVSLGSGTSLTSGTVGFRATSVPAPGPSATLAPRSSEPTVTVSVTGETTLQLTVDDDFVIDCDYAYEDEDNWTLTTTGDGSEVWTPYTGLEVDEGEFTGTVTSVDGDEHWNISTPPLTWTDVVAGVTATSMLTLSDECPLEEHCPTASSDSLFVGMTNAGVDFDSGDIPDVTATGAFLADGSWLRWDALSEPITYEGVTLEDARMTFFIGQRDDEDPDMQMPDLSSLGGDNGVQVQLCGTFIVDIPDVPTVESDGCAAWTETGGVIAQTSMGGDFEPDDHNGITVNSATVDGYAWTSLTTMPVIVLNGSTLPLPSGQNTITAQVTLPGTVMEGLGTGISVDTPLEATGWFTAQGDFSLETDIPIGLTSSDVSLNAVILAIGKEGSTFDLSMTVDADIKAGPNRYPAEGFVGLAADIPGSGSDPSSGEVTVRLSVQGSANDYPEGGFDVASLIANGDFEPNNRSLIEGSFDDKVAPQGIVDGGFEGAYDRGNLLPDPGFDGPLRASGAGVDDSDAGADGVAHVDLMNPDAGNLDTGLSGNLMPNADFEDFDRLVNGDFEGVLKDGSAEYWRGSSWSIDATLGPPDGPTALVIDAQKSGDGATQTSDRPLQGGVTYQASAWAMSLTKSPPTLRLTIDPSGCDAAKATQDFTGLDGTWRQFSFTFVAPSGCTGFQLLAADAVAGTDMGLDGVRLDPVSFTVAHDVPYAAGPLIIDGLDYSSPPITRWDSDVQYAVDDAWMRAGLNSRACTGWTYNKDSIGYVNGNFDVSYKFKIPGGASEDTFKLAFWTKGYAKNEQVGYGYMLKSDGSDGGFYQFNNGSQTRLSTSDIPTLVRNDWYRVRITMDSGVARASVTPLTNPNSSGVEADKVTLPAASSTFPWAGSFGQVYAGSCSGNKAEWDDFTLNADQSQAKVRLDPAKAHTGNGVLVLNGRTPSWTALTPLQEQPLAGRAYTYSAWIRADKNVSGNLTIEADSAATNGEWWTVPFTATTTWQQVTITANVALSNDMTFRVGLVGMKETGVNVYVDDQVFQQIPWTPSPASPATSVPALTTTSDAYAGPWALKMVARGSTSSVTSTQAVAPVNGADYTVSAWVKAPVNTSGTLSWKESAGATKLPFTATTQWQRITMTVRSQGGSALPAVTVEIPAGATLLLDKVTVTSNRTASSDGARLGAPVIPSAWQSGTGVAVVNDSAVARSVPGALRLSSGATVSTSRDDTPMLGSTYVASAWVSAPAGSAPTITLTAYDSAGKKIGASTGTVSGTGSYAQMTTAYTVKNSTIRRFTIAITNTASATAYVDDVALRLDGLALMDPWVPGASTLQGAETTTGHSGANFLRLTAPATGQGSTSLRVPASSSTDDVSVTMWLRSSSSPAPCADVSLAATGSNGATVGSAHGQACLTTDWQSFTVGTPVSSAASSTTVSLSLPAGSVVDVDDATVQSVPVRTSTQMPTTVSLRAVTDAPSAPNVLVLQSAAPGRITLDDTVDTDGNPIKVTAGSTYTLTAFVKSLGTGTGTVPGTMSVAFNGVDGTPANQAFTATEDWQQVSLTFTATVAATSVRAQISTNSAASLAVDDVHLAPSLIVQERPWQAVSKDGASPTLTWAVYDDPERARDSSLGVLTMSQSGSGTQGVRYSVNEAISVGAVYQLSAWVRSPQPGSQGLLELATNGGTAEVVDASFTATGDWQLITARLPIARSGHSGFTAAVYVSGAGALDVDDVVLIDNAWQVSSDGGSSATQTIINDSASAQSGSGYLSLKNDGSGSATAYATVKDADGASTLLTFYARSGTATSVSVKAGPAGGAQSSSRYTITSAWTKIEVPVDAPDGDLSVAITNATPGSTLELDTVDLSDPAHPVDGVTTPLAHPDHGYAYLWDDAFGIPGMHLWAVTAQVQIIGGQPGLGVGATAYADPTKMGSLMVGTDWLKSDMALNVSKAEPCFSFDFIGTDTTKVSIANGALKAQEFSIAFAPRGCVIGNYIVPRGASLSFDAELGNGTVHLDLAAGRDDDNLPYFHGATAVTNLVIGGTTYSDMELTVDLTPVSQDVTFVGDFVLPVGLFYGDFTLDADSDALLIQGDASLRNWTIGSDDLSVQSMDFSMDLQAPFDGSCGSFTSSTSGKLTMTGDSGLKFQGKIGTRCGALTVLILQYDYKHGGATQKFSISYDSKSNMLEGGVYFGFDRSTSWTFFGYRYHRTMGIKVGVEYAADLSDPGSGEATIAGSLSVSNGSGSLSCSFGKGDDECSISAKVTVSGFTHKYSGTW